jgi:hypothetical protein
MQVMSFRVDEKSAKKLEELKRKTKLKKSKIIRKLILGASLSAPPIILPTSELNRIGNNINQLARVANSTGEIKLDEFVREFEKLKEVLYGYYKNQGDT